MKPCGCRHNPALPRFHSGDYQELWNRMFDALPKVTQAELLKKGAHNRKIVSLFNAKVMREWEKKQMRPNPLKKRRFTFVKGGGLLDRKTGKIRHFRRKKKNPLRVRRLPTPKQFGDMMGVSHGQLKQGYLRNAADLDRLAKKAELKGSYRGFTADQYKAHAAKFRQIAGTLNPIRVRRLSSGKFSVKSGRHVHAKATTRLRAMRQASLIRGVKHGWRPTGRPARDVRRKLRRLSRKPGGSLSTIFGVRRGRRWTIRTKPGGGRVIAKGLSLDQLRARARKAGYKVRSL